MDVKIFMEHTHLNYKLLCHKYFRLYALECLSIRLSFPLVRHNLFVINAESLAVSFLLYIFIVSKPILGGNPDNNYHEQIPQSLQLFVFKIT